MRRLELFNINYFIVATKPQSRLEETKMQNASYLGLPQYHVMSVFLLPLLFHPIIFWSTLDAKSDHSAGWADRKPTLKRVAIY